MKYAKEEKFMNFGFREPKISSLASFTEELNKFFCETQCLFQTVGTCMLFSCL